MSVFCKVLIKRGDPFSENLCVSDSTSDESNIYKQKMKVNYSSTVSARPTVIFTVLNTNVHRDKSLDQHPDKVSQLRTFYAIEYTYRDFPCHLIVKRDKLELINRRWKCKKEKGWRLRLVHLRNLTSIITISPAVIHAVTVTVVRDKKIRTG